VRKALAVKTALKGDRKKQWPREAGVMPWGAKCVREEGGERGKKMTPCDAERGAFHIWEGRPGKILTQ